MTTRMNDPSHLLEDDLPDGVASMLRAAEEDVHPDAAAQGSRLLSRFGKGTVAAAAPSATMTVAHRFGSLRRVLSYTGLAVAVAGMAAYGWQSAETEAPRNTPRTASSVASAPIAPVTTVAEPVNALPSIDVTALPSTTSEPRRASSHKARKTERPTASLVHSPMRPTRSKCARWRRWVGGPKHACWPSAFSPGAQIHLMRSRYAQRQGSLDETPPTDRSRSPCGPPPPVN
ncbi:MAG: hypothetical protein K0S65_3689 [Labilithrix sp.]|nr:hypothetical protein [Labilithrix sp.]